MKLKSSWIYYLQLQIQVHFRFFSNEFEWYKTTIALKGALYFAYSEYLFFNAKFERIDKSRDRFSLFDTNVVFDVSNDFNTRLLEHYSFHCYQETIL